ncbi:MAG: hypothetical protein P9M03_08700, partial [Candidatus Theseobacter exili]|nr:hypothetical protein [Candidatus Theseobacter exili]
GTVLIDVGHRCRDMIHLLRCELGLEPFERFIAPCRTQVHVLIYHIDSSLFCIIYGYDPSPNIFCQEKIVAVVTIVSNRIKRTSMIPRQKPGPKKKQKD